MKRPLIFIVLILVLAGGIYYWSATPAPSPDVKTRTANFVLLEPMPNAKVTSPLTVKGEATGYWYFEGSFPIEVQSMDGKTLGIGIAQAEGEWMTTDFVPFTAEISFSAKPGPLKLVPKRENPSGLPENDYSLEFPLEY